MQGAHFQGPLAGLPAASILAATGDAVARFDANGTVLAVNAEACRIMESDSNQLVGRQIADFLRDDLPTEIRSVLDDFLAGDRDAVRMSARADVLIRRPDGSGVPVIVGMAWLPERQGFIVMFSDSSMRLEVERRAAALEIRYEDLFQNIPLPIWESDMTGLVPWLDELPVPPSETAAYLASNPDVLLAHLGDISIRAVNRAGLGQLGAVSSSPDAIKDAIEAAVHVDSIGGYPEQMQAIRMGQQSVLARGIGGHASGTRFDMDVYQYIPMGPDGLDLSRVIVTIIDTSQARRTAAELESALEARDQLVSSVAHELRTPLSVVVGLVHALIDDHDLSEDRRAELLAMTAAESDDLTHLIEDLLTYSRPAPEDIVVVPERLDLRALVDGVRVHPHDPSRSPRISVDGSAEVVADPRRVRQITRNLLTNAAKYGGDTIEVSMAADDGCVTLTVRDDGPGIPNGDSDSIFDPYTRGHDRTTQPSSIGIGLTISRRLARAMNGDLTYQRLNGWTVFQLTLPAASG